MALRKAIITVMLSALLVSSTAVPIYAVDDTESSVDTVTDEMELEEEDEESDPWGSEESELQEESEEQESITHESELSEQSQITEASKEESVVQESEQSQVSEQSKTEESSTVEHKLPQSQNEIKRGKQNIELRLTFNTVCAAPSYNVDVYDCCIDFSKIKLSLLTEDKKTVIKSFKITDEMLNYGLHTPGVNFDIEVPDWGVDGMTYYLRAENLPSLYKSSVQDMPIVCNVIDTTNAGDEIPEEYRGLTVQYAVDCAFEAKDFNNMFFLYNMEHKLIGNANMIVKCYNADDKVLFNSTVKVASDGIAILKVPTDLEIETIGVSVESLVDGAYVSGESTFDYDRFNASSSGVNTYAIKADVPYENTLYDDDGNRIENAKCAVVADINYNTQYDMSLFNFTDVSINVYSGSNIIDSLIFNKDIKSRNIYLIEGSKYTVKSVGNYDYTVSISPNTVTAKEGTTVSISAVPQLSLTVINEENGVRNNAHFKIESNEYNDKEHQFAVNNGASYKVINLDTGKEYSVIIGAYKSTILNIFDGSIQEKDFVGGSTSIKTNNSNTSTGTGINTDNIYSVPKTGDIVFSIIMILTGITGLSYLGYLYFKRKGIKHNEAKK